MKDYQEKGDIYEITLDNGTIKKVSKKWVEKSVQALDTDIEDVLLMWLEDNEYLVNEEQEELNIKAKKNKVKLNAKEKAERKPTTRERKPNIDKEYIIGCIAEYLENLTEKTNIIIENVGKLINFTYNNKQFKLNLTETRVKKQ